MQYHRYRVKLVNPGNKIEIEIYNPLGENIESPKVDSVLSQVPPKIAKLVKKARDTRTPLKIHEIKELGELLYEILFPETVDNIFRKLLLDTDPNETILHLELCLDDVPYISALPWEFMRAPQTTRWTADNLGTHPNVVLSRRRPLWVPPSSVILDDFLRILLIVSKPKDQKLGEVVYKEVEEALLKLVTLDSLPSKLSLEVLDEATAKLISNKLENYRPHIIHFIGHGRLHQKKAQLALVNDFGGTDWRSDEQISELLQGYEPRIMFLQACESAKQSSVDALVGVASQIIQRRVPIVIAMQYQVPNFVAVTLVEEFYCRLAKLEPVDTSLQKSRFHLRNKFPGKHYFAIPVLFMGINDGQIFNQLAPHEEAASPVISAGQPPFSSTIMPPPDPPDLYVGRQTDIDILIDELTHEEGRIVAICGTSGVGKSTLAKKLAKELHDKFSGRIYWINFKDNSNISARTIWIEIAHVVGHSLILETNASDFIVESYIKNLLTDYRCLLIIDGAEWPSRLATDLVRCRGRSSILITTQDSYNATKHGSLYPLRVLSPDEATYLLSSHCRFYLENRPDEIQYIEMICKKLEYHPFLINEAGGYIVSTQTPLPEYLDLLNKQQLKDFFSDSLLTPLSLRWEKLQDIERQLLKVISLAAEEDVELAAIATGTELNPTSADKIAKTLVANSIIDRGRIKQPARPENASYTMHYLWRRYIRENAVSVAEQNTIRMKLAGFYFGRQSFIPEIINIYQPVTYRMDLVSIEKGYARLLSKSPVRQSAPKPDHTRAERAESYYRRGLVSYERKQYEFALVYFDQAIQIDPEQKLAYYERGLTHTKLRQYSKALADFTRFIQLNPDNAQAYAQRGQIYEKLRHYGESLVDWTQTIRLEPNNANAYASRATVYARLNRYQEALVDYDRAIQLDPSNLDFQSSRNQIEEISKQATFESNQIGQSLQLNVLHGETPDRDMPLIKQGRDIVIDTVDAQSYYNSMYTQNEENIAFFGELQQYRPTDAAIQTFKQVNSIKEMRDTISRFPFMIKPDFIAIVEGLINEIEISDVKSSLERNLIWLRQITNQQNEEEQS